MYKKKLILLLLLFPFYARSMQRQMVPYDRHFNQNNDTNDSQDTQSKIIALDNQVVFLKKELAESNNKLNRALLVVTNLYQEQEAKKVGKAEKKAERDAQYKEVQEKREQEARKAWYVRLNNLIPAYLPVATSAAGYAAGYVVAKNMYNSVCPNIVKNAPLINETIQAGVQACGGKAGLSIAKLVIKHAPETFEKARKKYAATHENMQWATEKILEMPIIGIKFGTEATGSISKAAFRMVIPNRYEHLWFWERFCLELVS